MHRFAKAADEGGEIADARRQHRLDALAHAARDHRRRAAGADGNDDVAAIDDRGKDESGMREIVHHIDGQTDRLRARRHRNADVAGAGAENRNDTREIGGERIARGRLDPRGIRGVEPSQIMIAVGRKPADPRARPKPAGAISRARVRPLRRAAPRRFADRETRAGSACDTRFPQLAGLTGIIFYICLDQAAAKRKLFLLYCSATLEFFHSEVQGQEMHLLDNESGGHGLRPAAFTKASSVPKILADGRPAAPLDGPPRRTRGAEHLHSARGVRAVEEARAAVVAGEGFQRDDLAGAQGLLRPRAVPGAARRHRQEISGDVCVPRSLRQGMGSRSQDRALPADRRRRSDLAAGRTLRRAQDRRTEMGADQIWF